MVRPLLQLTNSHLNLPIYRRTPLVSSLIEYIAFTYTLCIIAYILQLGYKPLSHFQIIAYNGVYCHG